MKQKNYNKPTINQMAQIITEQQKVLASLIYEVQDLRSAFGAYLDYKKDTKKYIKWVENKVQNSKITSKKTPTSSKKKTVG